jgi:predicted nucleotidyltransferase
MTMMTRTWQQLAPRRGAISQLSPGDPDAWAARLRFDRERAAANQSAELTVITEVAIERARDAGAEAMVLSGSTARGRRTRVSDLDYHVIGATSWRVTDLPADIDLYADDVDRFWTKLQKGDDFAHWSIWYGCVLFDSGVIRDAATYVAEQDAWPDADRKLRQARNALDFAEQIAGSGDCRAALEQTRGALSLVARWSLLSNDVFPLARDELAGQLEQLGQARLAVDLRRSIREQPSVDDLRNALVHARAITGAAV